jgi:hypothetical protein
MNLKTEKKMGVKMTISDVQSIFGKQFYADDQTERVFGIRPQHIPLPEYWTWKDYEMHAKEGHMLICYPDRQQNSKPITLEEMSTSYARQDGLPAGLLWSDQFGKSGNYGEGTWMKNDLLVSSTVLRSGWQFVSPEALVGTASKDFINQMDVLIGNMESLLNGRLPQALQIAISKWEGYEREVANQLHYVLGNNVGATYFLSSLDIVRLLREPVQNTLFRYLIVHGCTGDKLFKDFYSWSSSPSSGGRLLFFGVEDLSGANVNGNPPVSLHPLLCAVASRMGF